jgi:hypothetical protein
MTFLLVAILAGVETQESPITQEKLEDLLFECRAGSRGDAKTKTKAAEALSKIGDEFIPILIRALGGTYPERVARRIEEAEKEGVAYRGDVGSLGIEHWVGEAIVKGGERMVPALLESLPSIPGPTATIAWLLGRIGDRRANPALLKLLQEKTRGWHVRVVAADSLRRLKAREAVPHLIETLEESTTSEVVEEMNRMANTLAKFTGQSFGLKLVPERVTLSKEGTIPAHYDLPSAAPERRAAVELWKQWWKESGQEFLRQEK